MRYALTYYKNNLAGKNIVDRFKELAFNPHIPIIELKKETIYSNIDTKKYPQLKNIDFLIFASTHRSKNNVPALTVHTPGNFRGNDLGGEPGKVCKTSALVVKHLFNELNKKINEEKNRNLKEKYEITMEATHHGPLTDIPCCFVELGCTEKEFKDKEAAKLLAEMIQTLNNYKENEKWIPTMGIGGPHYTPRFNKLQLSSNYAIGHIIAEYNLPLTEPIIAEAERKTKEQIKEVIVDWKGCGKAEDRDKTLEIIKNAGLKVIKTKEVK
ncbi:hypothetical protein CMI42_05900 [Candidatus Pacearchaeota archaeon]|nr:hypothetical protein [Candidatus Pacearchaeota archaeon]